MRFLLGILFFVAISSKSLAQTWHSEVTVFDLPLIIHKPETTTPSEGFETVVVLKGVGTGPVYQSKDRLVIEVDYSQVKPDPATLAPDVLKLRKELTSKASALTGDSPVNPNRIFILPQGYTLETDIPYDQQGDRTLSADLMYPLETSGVPLLIEITCDNVHRMGSGSLLYCQDTLLEMGMFHRFAVAMIDHPVAPPYKGIDDIPVNRISMIRAVETLRKKARQLGLDTRIGLMGFSRGATMAVSVASEPGLVQAALVHGNRFDYTRLLPDDKMMPRFEKAWGPPGEKWVRQSAMHYLSRECAPMFLNTSNAESPEYQLGLKQLHDKLTELGVEHVYQVDSDGRGHRVTTDPQRIRQIMSFFDQHLRQVLSQQ
ncbi:MAG: hypothetical protein KatS3mg104_1771 [Phycisphaerae bacterium]|jgi:hypothetical protein|nr:MAG: hypothetical protein KatS3mg104_1771 [Phycisphaerae bacterium]